MVLFVSALFYLIYRPLTKTQLIAIMGCLNSKGGGSKGNDNATGGDNKNTLANTGNGKA